MAWHTLARGPRHMLAKPTIFALRPLHTCLACWGHQASVVAGGIAHCLFLATRASVFSPQELDAKTQGSLFLSPGAGAQGQEFVPAYKGSQSARGLDAVGDMLCASGL